MEAAALFIGGLLVGIGLLLIQRDHLLGQLNDVRAKLYDVQVRAARASRATPQPKDWPPGTIPVELAMTVHDEWRKAGYHLVGDTRVVLRLLSIAHRCMCLRAPTSLASATYNDGDRCPPAKVACRSFQTGDCTFPACECEAVEPAPPPLPINKPKPGKKG